MWRCIKQLFSILSPLCLQTRGVADRCVTRQERQLHFILPPISFFHRTIGGGDVCGSASSVDQAMDVLRTDHSAVNGVEWYAQTLNDELQTQCAVFQFVMCLNDPSVQCVQFASPYLKWYTEVDAIDHVSRSYPPASNGHISTLQLFGFVQHDYRFP
ncbi:hypothetical protein TNCV_1123001 [Trichonephila clavipes]|uniref:Secreted protein n=1 Tax=Trichonephila clavipes TaxID=2585209 RepID=A0A8X6VA81_TRICX|nr:hypothetical protein TNCV_1123001 [Trichonephila clavipes]